jgi:two-component system response regulator FixJ
MTNQVLVVDDDPGVRTSLAALLEAGGYRVGVHGDGETLIGDPDLAVAAAVLLDIEMPGRDGLSLLGDLMGRPRAPCVVMISGHGDIPTAVQAMQRGAIDFIEKPFDPERVLDAVARAVRLSDGAQDHAPNGGALNGLSPREREVLAHLVAGEANKVVARALGISPRTVEVHRARIMQKLEVRSFAELVRLAIANGVTLGAART